jgi:hypothetical protein
MARVGIEKWVRKSVVDALCRTFACDSVGFCTYPALQFLMATAAQPPFFLLGFCDLHDNLYDLIFLITPSKNHATTSHHAARRQPATLD